MIPPALILRNLTPTRTSKLCPRVMIRTWIGQIQQALTRKFHFHVLLRTSRSFLQLLVLSKALKHLQQVLSNLSRLPLGSRLPIAEWLISPCPLESMISPFLIANCPDTTLHIDLQSILLALRRYTAYWARASIFASVYIIGKTRRNGSRRAALLSAFAGLNTMSKPRGDSRRVGVGLEL